MSREIEQQEWVETLASRIDGLGLLPVALSLLEIAKALGFLGSQMLFIVQPLLTGIVDDATFERTVTLLESQELLERFRIRLEEQESWERS